MTPFAAIDFETAGYDPASACSLGVVAANEDGSVTEWHRLIRPPVMEKAVKQRFVTGSGGVERSGGRRMGTMRISSISGVVSLHSRTRRKGE